VTVIPVITFAVRVADAVASDPPPPVNVNIGTE